MGTPQDNSDGMKYVKSIKDAVRRRFAMTYLEWIRAGRVGSMPSRGALSNARAKSLTMNLDALG